MNKEEDLNGVKTWRDGEAWIGSLIDSITTNIKKPWSPARRTLECFKQWEQFLNLDVDEYVKLKARRPDPRGNQMYEP